MPRDASGKTCFLDSDDVLAVGRHFDWLAAEPGLGLLTGVAGLGKTTVLRHLCDARMRVPYPVGVHATLQTGPPGQSG